MCARRDHSSYLKIYVVYQTKEQGKTICKIRSIKATKPIQMGGKYGLYNKYNTMATSSINTYTNTPTTTTTTNIIAASIFYIFFFISYSIHINRLMNPCRGRWLYPAEIIDLLKGLIIGVCVYVMTYIDTSMMYHIIKSQSVIKLYLFYNMLEVYNFYNKYHKIRFVFTKYSFYLY